MTMRFVGLGLALLLWAPVAGAASLFFINGLGPSGAFTEAPEIAMRSLRLAAREGFEFGVRTTPVLSLAPALAVFAARRWASKIGDIVASLIAGLTVFALLFVWTLIYPLDPLLGGIMPVILVVLLVGATFTGLLITILRPRATPPTPAS